LVKLPGAAELLRGLTNSVGPLHKNTPFNSSLIFILILSPLLRLSLLSDVKEKYTIIRNFDLERLLFYRLLETEFLYRAVLTVPETVLYRAVLTVPETVLYRAVLTVPETVLPAPN